MEMNKAEYTYVNEHLISSSLICPICFNVLEDPHIHTLCDSAFCRSCLTQLVEPNCPICRHYFDDILPIEYNRHLPKANRLIRNMLDELPVECLQCHMVLRRGQFQHDCQSSRTSLPSKPEKFPIFQMVFSLLPIIFSIFVIFYYRHLVFEPANNRRGPLINNVGIDIDKYLFEKIYYLTIKLIEYFIPIFVFNLLLWFGILFYGDRFTSKTASRILQKLVEISIIVNLIGYSLYY